MRFVMSDFITLVELDNIVYQVSIDFYWRRGAMKTRTPGAFDRTIPAQHPPFRVFAVVIAIAFALRLGAALILPNVDWPDEIFQTLEPAYRMVTGQGIVTWEWREGIRSPLFPAFLAGPIALATEVGMGPSVFIPAITLLLSLLSTAVVAAAFMIGRRLGGRSGAVIAGSLCAFWPDLIYYGPKTLSEVQAGNLLILAAYTGWYAQGTWNGQPPTRSLVTGLLIGLALCFRIQLAPALAIVAVGTARIDSRRRWPMLIAGALIPIGAMGALDAIYWGFPFASLWRNIDVNLVQGVSSEYGVKWAGWYGQILTLRWHVATLAVVVSFVLGVRLAPGLAAIAAVVLLSHSLIAHKELRFIYPALPPLLIVCGLGTAKLFGAPALARLRPYGAIAPVGAWMILSFAVAVAPQMRLAWRNRAANLQAWRTLSADHQICGIGLRYPDVGWWDTGGEVELGRDVPLYAFSTPEGAARTLPSFNAALGARNLGEALAGFRLTHCWSAASKEICVFRAEPDRKCLADPSVALNGLHDLGRVKQNGLRADASE